MTVDNYKFWATQAITTATEIDGAFRGQVSMEVTQMVQLQQNY